MKKKTRTIAIWALLLAGWAALPGAPPAAAQTTGLPGDTNLDGVVNVLDVQTSVNMALGQADANGEADVDENEAVDVRDVQTITNTVLGTGGLVQRVAGTILPPGGNGDTSDLSIAAVSTDGRLATTPVEPDSGAFEIGLDVKTAWTFAIVRGEGAAAEMAGTLVFPLGDDGLSSTLPLPNLSLGEVLELGTLSLAVRAPATSDVRGLLGQTAEPLELVDEDANGASDVLEELLLPLPLPTSGPLGNLAALLDGTDLVRRLDVCLDGLGVSEIAPDLTGIEDGIPDVIKPLFDCLEEVLVDWLLEELDVDSFLRPLVRGVAEDLVEDLVDELEEVLAGLEQPELTDTDGNHVPDYIEEELCLFQVPTDFGSESGCLLDSDNNGIPDFAEDSDGDGVPNFLDDDTVIEGDQDRDGVPDASDVDGDNNGIPDYAESNV